MFQRIGRPIAESCLQGYHCCLLAYGQTGAGKTFTMEGPTSDYAEVSNVTQGLNRSPNPSSSELRGLIPRVLDYIFTKTAQEKEMNGGALDYAIKCSYLQIYNENVSDLLDPEQTNLTIREDVKRGHYVEGLQEVVVPNAEACYGTLRRGSANRHVGMTAMNAESSRSHAVFTVVVESQRRGEKGMMTKRISRFYLVDLAGSERQKHSEAMGVRLKEAGGINKSLSALGNVIKALVDTGEGKIRHVPYRDSKLTFLLKDALGGNSKCSLVANISPAEKNVEETLSTLKFAQRAKMMRNTATVNEDCFGNPATMGEEIKRLRLEIAVLKANMGSPTSVELSAAPPPMDEAEASQAARLTYIIQQSSKRHLWLERKNQQELDKLTAQLDAERAVNERLHTAIQAHKMIIKLREANIKRLETGRPRTDAELAQDVREEMESLRRQVDFHPDAVKFSMEVDMLKAQVEELMSERDDDEDVTARLEQTEALYKTVSSELESTLVQANKLKTELAAAKQEEEVAKQEQQAFREKIAAMEEQARKQQELMDVVIAEGVTKDSKIEKLERALAKLEPTYKETAAQLEEERHQKDVLEVQMLDANERVKNAQKAADKYSNAFKEQSKLQEDLFAELQATSNDKDAAQKALEEVTAKLGTVNALEAQLADLQAGKAELEAKLQALVAEKDEGSRLLQVAQQASADLRTTISDLQDQLNAINEQHLAAVQEKNEAARARSAAESEVVALTDSRTDLQKQFDSVNEQLNTVNEQLLMSTQEKNELARARASVDGRMAELVASEAEAKQQLEGVAGQLSEASNERNGLAETVSRIQAEKDSLEKRFEQLAAEKADGESQLGAEISQLHAKVEGLDLKADELEKKLGNQKERLGELGAEKEASEKKVAELLSAAEEKEAALTKLQAQVVQLEDDLGKMTKEKDTLADQFAQEWGKAEAAEARFNQAKTDAESIKVELDLARKDKAAADEFLSLLMNEKQQLKEAHDSHLEERGTLEQTLNEREKLVHEKDTLLVQLGERAAALVKEKEGLDAALKAAAAEAEATALKLRAVESMLQKAEDGRLTAEGALEEASKEVQAVKDEMEGLKRELNNAKSEATKLIHRVNGLEDDTIHLQTSLADEKDAKAAAEQLVQERNEQITALSLAEKNLLTSLTASEAELAAKSAEASALSAQVASLETELTKAVDDAREKGAAVARLEGQLAAVEGEQRALLERAQEATVRAAQLEKEFARMEEEKRGLAEQLAEAQGHVGRVEAEAAELTARIEVLEAAKSDLLVRVAAAESALDAAHSEAAELLEAEKDALLAEHQKALSTLQNALRTTDALASEQATAIEKIEETVRALEEERDAIAAEHAAAMKAAGEERVAIVEEHGAAVAALEERLRAAKKEREALVSTHAAAVAALEEAVNNAAKEKEALVLDHAAAVASLEEALDDAAKQKEALVFDHAAEVAALENAVTTAEEGGKAAVAAALEKQERECAANLGTLRKQMEEKVRECEGAVAEKERLLEKVESLKGDSMKLIDEIVSRVAALTSEKEALMEEHAAVVSGYEERLVEAEKELSELERRLDDETVRAKASQRLADAASDAVAMLETKTGELREELTSERAQLEAARAGSQESQAELVEKAGDIAGLEGRLADARATEAALRAEVEASQTAQKEAQSDLAKTRAAMEYKLGEAEKWAEIQRAELDDRQNAAVMLLTALEEKERALGEVTRSLAAAEAEAVALREERERWNAEIAVLEGSLLAFEEQIEGLQKEKAVALDERARARREVARLKGDLEAAKASLEVAEEGEADEARTPIGEKPSEVLKRHIKSGGKKAERSMMSPGADVSTAIPLDTPSPKSAAGEETQSYSLNGAARAQPGDMAASARLKKIVAARAASAPQRQPLGSLQTNNVDSKRSGESPVQKVRYSLRSRLKPDETSPAAEELTSKRSRLA
ncbi:hypothetical protein KFL_000410070 [Klebsormidium nitens]|uniref:Kinesin motor domain-containing protein n=1 Tax=Klebsormidium nitens TaxID=105231 RepID=A0A1Y1HTP1_KLENI|nr:hypothetical protein KFL_000410070 [Klebsormidium nitens]|eukprot:GAQ79907.1 hypothetical protein KFL_000410070 [Klebsormidium nitens]